MRSIETVLVPIGIGMRSVIKPVKMFFDTPAILDNSNCACQTSCLARRKPEYAKVQSHAETMTRIGIAVMLLIQTSDGSQKGVGHAIHQSRGIRTVWRHALGKQDNGSVVSLTEIAESHDVPKRKTAQFLI